MVRKEMNSREVRKAIEDFESGDVSVLIGTDKISRGIDFASLEQVILSIIAEILKKTSRSSTSVPLIQLRTI